MTLTRRQAEIVDLIASGLADKQIAVELGVSQYTVRAHLQRLYREHGYRNRAEAVAARLAEREVAREAQLVQRPSPISWRDGAVLGLVTALLMLIPLLAPA